MSSLFFLRMAIGVIFLVHSIPKLKNPGHMASGIGWSSGQVLGLGIVEFIGALNMIGGLGVKFAALVFMVVMSGAIYHKVNKWKLPFSATNATGWEFDFLIFLGSLTIFLS